MRGEKEKSEDAWEAGKGRDCSRGGRPPGAICWRPWCCSNITATWCCCKQGTAERARSGRRRQ
eukprot:6031248-Prorocentrum_lima.AAC.1